MLNRRAWDEAAILYIEAIDLIEGRPSQELREHLEQALYLGANGQGAIGIWRSVPKGIIGLDFMDVLRARHALYQYGPARARFITSKLNEKKVNLPTLNLLEAEILIGENNYEAAKSKLEILKNDPGVPQWIRLGSEILLNEEIP